MNIGDYKMQIMKNRISYIDIAKGIGIFLVIWGHIILSGPAYNIIYAFHMPLFFSYQVKKIKKTNLYFWY